MSNTIFYIMGVSGCGKSTIGTLLATALSIPFFDGDDYHPKSNIDKMASGNPLTDKDRRGWLVRLNLLAHEHKEKGAVIACSALKKNYREMLQNDLRDNVQWIYLKGTFAEISQRLQERQGHFMPPDLLRSQFETLEPPKNAMEISIMKRPEEIVKEIVQNIP